MPRKPSATPPVKTTYSNEDFKGFVRIDLTEHELGLFDKQMAANLFDLNEIIKRLTQCKFTLTPRDDGTYNACFFPKFEPLKGFGISAFSDDPFEAVAMAYWKYMAALDGSIAMTTVAEKKRRG